MQDLNFKVKGHIGARMTGSDEIERNRRLAENIAAGKSKAQLDDEMIEAIRQNGLALLDIPGPRVVQLIEMLEMLRVQAEHGPGLKCYFCGRPAFEVAYGFTRCDQGRCHEKAHGRFAGEVRDAVVKVVFT